MIKWHSARYWYFITQVDMGEVMSLSPRKPIGMNDDEPNTKRICVAKSAAYCMSAINLYAGKLYVYRTRRKVKGRVPYNVYDSHITGEHWLMTKTRFTRVDILDLTVKGIHPPFWYDLDVETEQVRAKRAIVSWCKRRDPRLAINRKSDSLWRNKK